MSWVLSFVVVSLLFSTPGNFSFFSNENSIAAKTSQSVLVGDETERFEQTYPLSATGKVSVDNVNGSIVIEAWDRNEVKLEVVKIADSKERLSQVDVNIESNPNSFRVETEFGNWKNGNRSWNCSGYCRLEVQYKLTVPRTAILNNIETVNGSVTISNMTNYTRASAVNGSVKASNLRGTAHIETVNGTSEVDFESLNSDSKINLSTVNGRVNLTIPSDADATIKADTVNGSITNDFGLPVRKGKYVGRDMYGKVGDGKVKIDLDSVNGGLNIKRRADGKSLKPVTNLLNMKDNEDDSDDEDDEDSVSVTTTSRMNKEIAKSVKESTKIAVAESAKIAAEAPRIAAEALRESSRAMRENSKEIERAQRDAMRATRDAMRATQEAMRNTQDAFRWEFANNWNSSKVEEQSETFNVKGTPKVTVDAKNCSVMVKGWDRQEVKYRVVKFIRGSVQPAVGISVSHTDSEVTINANVQGQKIKNDNGKDKEKTNLTLNLDGATVTTDADGTFSVLPTNAVRVEVFVPKKSNLRILTNREIRVDGVTGNIDLTGNDGAINVRDSEGKLKIAAADALVRVIGFTGEVDSRTTDGENYFEGDFTKFFAKSGDGKLVLTLPEDVNANIEANSTINLEGFECSDSEENENRRKIGEGGTIYKLQVAEGEILVRNANLLKSTN